MEFFFSITIFVLPTISQFCSSSCSNRSPLLCTSSPSCYKAGKLLTRASGPDKDNDWPWYHDSDMIRCRADLTELLWPWRHNRTHIKEGRLSYTIECLLGYGCYSICYLVSYILRPSNSLWWSGKFPILNSSIISLCYQPLYACMTCHLYTPSLPALTPPWLTPLHVDNVTVYSTVSFSPQGWYLRWWLFTGTFFAVLGSWTFYWNFVFLSKSAKISNISTHKN